MEQHGFSLVEVLLSLALTTTIVYFLLQLQGINRSLLGQRLVQAETLLRLENREEEHIAYEIIEPVDFVVVEHD